MHWNFEKSKVYKEKITTNCFSGPPDRVEVHNIYMKMENNAFQVDSDYDEWMDEFNFKVREREEKNQGTFSLSTAMKLKLIYKQ